MVLFRTSGCFTSSGLIIVDSSPSDLNAVHSRGIVMSSVHSPLCYSSDSEFLRSVSDSDSASDCGSDMLSESGCTQVCEVNSKLFLKAHDQTLNASSHPILHCR